MKLITSLIFALIFNSFAFGQSRAQIIDSICSVIHSQHPELGMSIAFVDHKKDYFFNYGTISRKSTSKVDEKTIYPIGSLTKLFTANLIVQAQNEGKLNIEDYIDDYLPNDFILSKDIQKKIKISDLASHQSGLPNFNFTELMEIHPKQPLNINLETMHSIVNDSTVLSDYGNYRYSNVGYVLLGMILKDMYAKDFASLVTEKIFEPIQMDLTLTSDFAVQNRVLGYDPNGAEQILWDWNDLSAPAGLLKSNTLDMVKFLKNTMYAKNKVSEAAITTEITFYKNTIREVGFGPQIERIGNDTYYFKTGNTFSGSSLLAYDKQSNWGLLILINQQNLGLIDEMINTIYQQALSISH